MERARFAGLAAHREKHAAMQLTSSLKAWLVKHINGTDKQYAEALLKAGIA